MFEPPATIVCVDCGGTCHLTTAIDDPGEHGDGSEVIAVYRCEDCRDRWDVVFDSRDVDDG